MTRILSYNILVGGTPRVQQIAKIIASVQPDVVGLVEATNSRVVKELAQRLEMQYVISGNGKHPRDWQSAVLSRLPIVRTQTHVYPDILTKPALEVCVEESNGQQFTVFVTHLTAAFNESWAGDGVRRREVQELLRLMAKQWGTPHLLMGDFNALAPGDRMQPSMLLRYVLEKEPLHRANPKVDTGHPYLNFIVPPPLRILNPILRVIPRSKVLSALFDEVGSLYAPRRSIGILRRAGYVDCFRRMNPEKPGFTCPATSPAGRIDYIFASPEMAQRLSRCEVVMEGEGVRGEDASDHFPVMAEFGIPVEDVAEREITPEVEVKQRNRV